MNSNRQLKAGIVPMAKAKKAAILAAVRQVGGDVGLAAERLEIGRTTLYRKLREYGFTPRKHRTEGDRFKRRKN